MTIGRRSLSLEALQFILILLSLHHPHLKMTVLKFPQLLKGNIHLIQFDIYLWIFMRSMGLLKFSAQTSLQRHC